MTERERRGASARRSWRPVLIASGIVIAAGLFTAPWAFSAFRHGHDEHAAEFVEFMLDRALWRVDASEEQREAVLAIAREAREKIWALREGGAARHTAFVDQLVEDPGDTERLEALREEQLADMEAASRILVGSLARISAELTPEQRAELAQFHRERRARWHH